MADNLQCHPPEPGGSPPANGDTGQCDSPVTGPFASGLDVPLVLTVFEDRFASTKQEWSCTLRQCQPHLQNTTANGKTNLRLLKGARFGDLRSKKGSLRTNANVQSINCIIVDYDGGQIHPEQIAEILECHKLAAIVYTSPSHTDSNPRWRLMVPLAREHLPAEHEHFVAILDVLCGAILASESYTLSQSYYWGSVNSNPAHIVISVEGRPLDLCGELTSLGQMRLAERRKGSNAIAPPARNSVSDGNFYPTEDQKLSFCTKIVAPIRGAKVGTRRDAIKRAARLLGGYADELGWDDNQLIAILMSAWHENPTVTGDDVDDFEACAIAMIEVGRQAPISLQAGMLKWGNDPGIDFGHIDLAEDGQAPSPVSALSVAVSDWQQSWQRNAKGVPLANYANVVTALRYAPELANVFTFNEMACECEIARPYGSIAAGKFPRDVTDADVFALWEFLQRRGLVSLGSGPCFSAVEHVARERRYHPVMAYLDGLTWDGTARLHSWLPAYAGAAQTAYTAAVGEMFFIALVARIYEPGCQADYVMTLCGDQGLQKSKLLRTIGGEWFSDALPDLRTSGRDVSQFLRGQWLVEIGELAALYRVDARILKAVITRRFERYRPSYGRRFISEPRTAILVGTSNAVQFLNDESGNRRFWPVDVISTIDVDALARDRDQLFAEAVSLYRTGRPWWPDRDFEQQHMAAQQAEHFEADAWEDVIRPYLICENRRVTVTDVLRNAVGLHESKARTGDQRRVSAILQHLGWRHGARGPSGERYWYSPDA